MNVKRRLLSASLWNLAGTGGQQIITFLLFIYLARHLNPSDVGLIALAVVFLDILGTVSRCGQVEALQRYITLEHRVASTSFWMLMLAGTASGVAVLLIGMSLRNLPDYAALGGVMLLLAPLSALQAWNAAPEAILKQRMEFRVLTIRTWAATLAGGVLAIYMVHRDYGVYALVGQRLAAAAVRTVLLWAMTHWRPRFAFDRSEAKQLLRIGFEIMLAGLAGVLNLRIADSITGLFLGPHQLGFLRLGFRFFDMTVQFAVAPVANVALSSFSKLREDAEQLRRAYLRLTQFIALASMPVCFGVGAVADVFVPLLLGQKWVPAVGVLQLLGLLMLPGTINCFFGPLMVAVGSTRVVLRQSIAQVFVTGVLLWIGARWGIQGVLIAHILRANLVSWYNLHAMHQAVDLKPLSVILMLAPATVACLVMVGVISLAKHELSQIASGFPLLGLLILIGAVTYGITLVGGDVVGFWKGHVGGAVRSLGGAFSKGRAAHAGKAV